VSTSLFQFADPSLNPDERIEMTIFGERQLLWFRGDFAAGQATDIEGGPEALEALVPADRSKRAVHPAGSRFNNRLTQTLTDGSISNTSITDVFNPDPRNFYLGPSAWNVDLSVVKYFSFNEDIRLRLTADFFNLFNHPKSKPIVQSVSCLLYFFMGQASFDWQSHHGDCAFNFAAHFKDC
jgi:hypothetical protein